MIPIFIEATVLDKILRLFLKVFPENTCKGVLEIYYGDGYAEYPMKFMDTNGSNIQRMFNGWDAPDMIAEKELVRLLSDNIRKTRDGLDKSSSLYWNHFLFVVENREVKMTEFSYQPELDEKHENKVRKSIGDELYNKYQKERNKDTNPTTN